MSVRNRLVQKLLSLISMIEPKKIRKIIRILMGSRFYFDLPLRERYDLVRYILRKFPFSV